MAEERGRVRAFRWARRTLWMARAVAADFGLVSGHMPVWRRDNPFWNKAVRADARRYLLAGRLLLTTLVLAILLVGGLVLHSLYPRIVQGALFNLHSSLNWQGWLFVAVSFVHILLILGTRQAFSPLFSREAQRQTLPLLLLSPLSRAEMVWAMAVAPAAAAGLVALSGLSVYVLLREFGGCEWRDIGWLYAVFLLLTFDPPSYARPALGADPPPVVTNARAARARPGGSNVLSSLPIYVFLTYIFGSWVRGMGGWGFHLLAALPPPVPDLLLNLFAWPFCAALALAAPLPFFGGHLAPFWYVVPLWAAGWVGSALHTGAALSAGDAADLRCLPLQRRAKTWSRWTGRLGWLCFWAFVWQPWVLGGDTARLFGPNAVGLPWDLAGLLLILGSAAIFGAAGQARQAVRCRRDTQTLRPARLLLRQGLRRAVRPLRLALLLFALLCLCGGVSPFAPPVYAILGRLALVAVSAVMASLGYAAWNLRRSAPNPAAKPLRAWLSLPVLALPWALPFAALSLPPLAPLAALSPVMAWLELFPAADATIHAFPYWSLGPLPPFALAVAAPFLLGAVLLAFAACPSRVTSDFALKAAPMPPTAETRPARHPEQTAALLAWVTARTDNPLFTYELRTRTRNGRWYDALTVAGALLLLIVIGVVLRPDAIEALSFLALLSFFHYGGWFSLVPPSMTRAWADVASLLLSLALFTLAFRGQMIGEALFWKDGERGALGTLLLTPLTAGSLFWGKVWGQSSGYVAGWAACGAASLLLYGLASPDMGLGSALAAWAVSLLFIAATFVLGVGLGAALATHTLRWRSLRGLSTLLLIVAYAGGFRLIVWPDLFSSFSMNPMLLTRHLVLGSLYALVLAVLAFIYALRCVAALRRGDMTFGEGGVRPLRLAKARHQVQARWKPPFRRGG